MPKSRFANIEKRGENSYRIKWTVGGVPDHETVRGTLADAERRRNVIEMQLSDGKPMSTTTFAEYWEATVWPSCDGLAPRTRSSYRSDWSKWIEPNIGHMRISRVTWHDLQYKVIDEISSPTKQRQVARLLSKICNMAVRDKLIAASPCHTSFIYKELVSREQTGVDTVSVVAYIEAVAHLKAAVPVLCMIGGGLRVEEASALWWEDLALWRYRGKTYVVVNVDKTLTLVDGRKSFRRKTKTDNSRRRMVIGAPFAPILVEKMAQGLSGPVMATGRPWDEGRAEDAYTSPSTMGHNLKDFCARRGITYVRPGDMRQSWSTMQSEAGTPDSLIAKAMGHTDGTVRGKHYLKMTPAILAMMADNLEQAIAEANGAALYDESSQMFPTFDYFPSSEPR